jgi:hypothetical protein
MITGLQDRDSTSVATCVRKMVNTRLLQCGGALKLFTLGIVLVTTLVGCAGVRVTPLNPDGTVASGAKEGMRYYMPAPYLLVARIPPVPSPPSASQNGTESQDLADEAEEQTKATKNPKPTKSPSDNAEPSTAPASGAPSSNTSFLASTPQYMLKLVYLPDKTRPMAVSVRTGLFGTASMKPGLQDGWMLTSLDASADSKTAETLSAIASLVGSATTAGAGAAPKAAMTTKKKATRAGGAEAVPDFSDQVLKPGLYKFVYDANGELVGLKAMTYFTDTGMEAASLAHAFSTGGKR